MSIYKSWKAMNTVLYFATGKHPILDYTPIKYYSEDKHKMLEWWYNIQGYDYDRVDSKGVSRDN